MAGSLHLSGPRVTGAGSLAAALLLALALLLLRLTPAGAHGVMINPKSRNWKAYMENKFWYAHGLNMGGGRRGKSAARARATALPPATPSAQCRTGAISRRARDLARSRAAGRAQPRPLACRAI